MVCSRATASRSCSNRGMGDLRPGGTGPRPGHGTHHTNDRAENIGWIPRDSGANMLLIESVSQWEALASLHGRLGGLRRILCLESGAGD